MSDNGCQPTSTAFMQVCSNLGIQQAFTSYNNPKGNADTERVRRTLKEECLWLKEWSCPFELIHALEVGITHYNEHLNWLRVLQTGLTSCSIGRKLNSPVRINLLHMRPAYDAYHRQKSRQHAHPCTIV